MTSPLTAWRNRLGLSQRGAAEALGCSRDAWRRWEANPDDAPRYIILAMQAIEANRRAERK